MYESFAKYYRFIVFIDVFLLLLSWVHVEQISMLCRQLKQRRYQCIAVGSREIVYVPQMELAIYYR